MKQRSFLWLAALATIVTACNSKTSSNTEVPHRTVFFDKTGMDTTYKPGNDFYMYANGSWVKKTKIPAAEVGWGSFYQVNEDNQKNLRGILEGLSAQNNAAGSNEQKVGDFYASGMDTVAMDKLNFDPIKPLLKKISVLSNYKEVVNFAAGGYRDGQGDLFGFAIAPDDKISTKYAVNFTQAGLNLPNCEYYTKTDSSSVKLRKAYVDYIATLFTLTGDSKPDAEKYAAEILKLETEIAKSHSTPVELRDPVKNYHKFYVPDLQKQIPDIDLKAVLAQLQVKIDTVLVGQPKYFVALNGLLKSQPIDIWKNKLRLDALNNAANLLGKNFRDARFNFFGKTLLGQKKNRDRWKKMVTNTDIKLGEVLGQVYVEKYFPAEAKKRMLDLVNNLQSVYKDRIEKLDWMSAATKKQAIEKLAAFTKKIGYPDKWKKYDDVTINKGTYYANQLAISQHNFKEETGKMGKPVDKTEWGMTPPTVNAYYNPAFNEIVFPAGVLQFPFFDKDADDAINYGGIGMVIGHEMTHGFDDQGAQYDKEGNLKNWWNKEDEAKFKAKVKVVVDQYNNYTVLNGLHVNGALTTGENIADIGGLAIAYQAFKNTPQGKSSTKIDGFTPDQRFFMGFAQVWRSKYRDETTRLLINVDTHSPDVARINGPLSNMPEFYKAFNVKPGDTLYREEKDRIKIW